jgi:hypothetical protein
MLKIIIRSFFSKKDKVSSNSGAKEFRGINNNFKLHKRKLLHNCFEDITQEKHQNYVTPQNKTR